MNNTLFLNYFKILYSIYELLLFICIEYIIYISKIEIHNNCLN